eukprot:SAG31_NODE_517_length_14689_cov_5.110487_5_plen_447_part_00
MLPSVFTRAECDELIAHQNDLRSGVSVLSSRAELASFNNFKPPPPGQWPRSMNQHLIDSYLQSWALHPKLEAPLRDCLLGESPQLIQSMYFWKSSSFGAENDGTFHQDQTPIPGVVSAWIALVDIGREQGPLDVQKGSHLQRAVWHETSIAADGSPAIDEHGNVRSRFQLEVVAENKRLGLKEARLFVKQGDVVFFHGRLLHKGSRPQDPNQFRHVLASHYIPASFAGYWPPLWVTRSEKDGPSQGLLRSHPRISFDGQHHFPAENGVELAGRENRMLEPAPRDWLLVAPSQVEPFRTAVSLASETVVEPMVLRSVLSPVEIAILLAKGPWQRSRWPLLKPRVANVLTALSMPGLVSDTDITWAHKTLKEHEENAPLAASCGLSFCFMLLLGSNVQGTGDLRDGDCAVCWGKQHADQDGVRLILWPNATTPNTTKPGSTTAVGPRL